MDIIEVQDMPGRSRNRVLENYRNVSRTRSSSTHKTLGARQESSRTRRTPTTVLVVFHNNIPTDENNENGVKESHNNNETINRDEFSRFLISSGTKVSPDRQCYQRAREKHRIFEQGSKSKSTSKRRSAQHKRLDQDYGNEQIVDYSIQNDLLLDNLTSKLENENDQARFYKYGNPDNSFRGLQSRESADLNNIYSDLSFATESRTNSTTPSSVIASAANKIYNRMSKLFAGERDSMYSISRVSSCYTLKGNAQLNERKLTRKDGLDATLRTGSLRYESELDDEDTELEEDCEPETTQEMSGKNDTGKNNIVFSNTNDNRRTTSNTYNYKETLQEINDFQNKFVKKYNNATPTPIGNLSQKNTSRTLQKVLDYKDLYFEEEDTTNSKSSGNLLSKWHPLVPGSSSFEYGIKIQHEAIMSEYTQIKLRFSSSLSGSSSETYSIPDEKSPSKLQMKSKTGVLGFVDRSMYFRVQGRQEKERSVENSDDTTGSVNHDFPQINSDNKDGYISKLWKSEVDRMFPTLDSFSSSSTYSDTPDLEHPRRMSVDLRSEDCDIYENRPNHGHTATKSIDLSQMARNVRFKRYA